MTSRFVVFRCHGNIDFCKITIIRNINLKPVSAKISRRFDEGKSTKNCLKILGMALEKLYRITLKAHFHPRCIARREPFSANFVYHETPKTLEKRFFHRLFAKPSFTYL